MDTQAAVEYLAGFQGCLDDSYEAWKQPGFRSAAWDEADRAVRERLLTAIEIARAAKPELTAELHEEESGYPWWTTQDATTQLLGYLRDQERREAILGPEGPSLTARGLHPTVWTAAARLWDDGHRRAALAAASEQINIELQAKLGRNDISGKDLMMQAFKLDEPKPDEPRLRFPQYEEGGESFKSAHEGARFFGAGCMLRIRNITTHNLSEPDEQVALEQLAALSVIARWIDEASVSCIETG